MDADDRYEAAWRAEVSTALGISEEECEGFSTEDLLELIQFRISMLDYEKSQLLAEAQRRHDAETDRVLADIDERMRAVKRRIIELRMEELREERGR